MCQLLVDNGADVNAALNGGDTPLHRACYTGKLNVVQLLLQNKAAASQGADGFTPLHKVCFLMLSHTNLDVKIGMLLDYDAEAYTCIVVL